MFCGEENLISYLERHLSAVLVGIAGLAVLGLLDVLSGSSQVCLQCLDAVARFRVVARKNFGKCSVDRKSDLSTVVQVER